MATQFPGLSHTPLVCESDLTQCAGGVSCDLLRVTSLGWRPPEVINLLPWALISDILSKS